MLVRTFQPECSQVSTYVTVAVEDADPVAFPAPPVAVAMAEERTLSAEPVMDALAVELKALRADAQ